MAICVTIFDETLSGERTGSLRLDLLSSTITLRELIRRRVYEEVQEYHAAPPSAVFRGFVTPTETETALNGPKPTRACQAARGLGGAVRAGVVGVRPQRLLCPCR